MLKTALTRLAQSAAAILLALGIAACGQSGPLYLPGNPSEVQVPPPQPAETEEEEDDESHPAEQR